MYVITASSPDQALQAGVAYLARAGVTESSRVGPVLVAPGPVATVYATPRNRVSFSALRDANPFFHLMESLWMLAGHNDVKLPAFYAPRLAEFSDDGRTLHGAYGFRWRNWFQYDQLDVIIKELVKNPTSRRCVLAMWDGLAAPDNIDFSDRGERSDLQVAVDGGKDVPCNTHAYFMMREGRLSMTVCCRSNDIVWGAYGANVVHFSMLLEYMALAIGVLVGEYTQISNNYHAYIERPDTARLFDTTAQITLPPPGVATPLSPLLFVDKRRAAFDRDVLGLLRSYATTNSMGPYSSYFIATVAEPMRQAFALYKDGQLNEAIEVLQRANKTDWALAGRHWLQRRATTRALKTEEVRPA